MTTRLTYLGVAGYLIEGPNRRILIDPFLSWNQATRSLIEELPAPDVILVTHAAFDHVGDAATIARRTGAPIVCGLDTRMLLVEQGVPIEQIKPTIWGIVVEVGGVVVRPVESHHWSQASLQDGRTISGTPLGFIVETESDVSVYHFGDSAIFGDMRLIGELYRPTIGLLGCTQPWELPQLPGPGRVLSGEMSPREAALAAEMLQVRFAIATHYTSTADENVREFIRTVPKLDTSGSRVALALEPGEVLTCTSDGYSVQANRL